MFLCRYLETNSKSDDPYNEAKMYRRAKPNIFFLLFAAHFLDSFFRYGIIHLARAQAFRKNKICYTDIHAGVRIMG